MECVESESHYLRRNAMITLDDIKTICQTAIQTNSKDLETSSQADWLQGRVDMAKMILETIEGQEQ
jgi:hypothetical protein